MSCLGLQRPHAEVAQLMLLLSPHVYMWISGSAQLCAGLTLQSDCHLRVGPSPVHTMQVSEALNHAGRMQLGVAC